MADLSEQLEQQELSLTALLNDLLEEGECRGRRKIKLRPYVERIRELAHSPSALRMKKALQEIGGYTGEGLSNADWRGMVRDLGQRAREALYGEGSEGRVAEVFCSKDALEAWARRLRFDAAKLAGGGQFSLGKAAGLLGAVALLPEPLRRAIDWPEPVPPETGLELESEKPEDVSEIDASVAAARRYVEALQRWMTKRGFVPAWVLASMLRSYRKERQGFPLPLEDCLPGRWQVASWREGMDAVQLQRPGWAGCLELAYMGDSKPKLHACSMDAPFVRVPVLGSGAFCYRWLPTESPGEAWLQIYALCKDLGMGSDPDLTGQEEVLRFIGDRHVASPAAWLVDEPGSDMKRCPDCGDLALEGQEECSRCGARPRDDQAWRLAGGLPKDQGGQDA